MVDWRHISPSPQAPPQRQVTPNKLQVTPKQVTTYQTSYKPLPNDSPYLNYLSLDPLVVTSRYTSRYKPLHTVTR